MSKQHLDLLSFLEPTIGCARLDIQDDPLLSIDRVIGRSGIELSISVSKQIILGYVIFKAKIMAQCI